MMYFIFLFLQPYDGGTWWSYLIGLIFFIIFLPLAMQKEFREKKELDERYARRKGITYDDLIRIRQTRRARSIRGSERKEVKYGLGNVSVVDYQPIYDSEQVRKYVTKHIGKDVDYDILFKS